MVYFHLFIFCILQLYDRLKRKYPKFRHKITAINGDVTLPNLGINEDDRKLIMEKVINDCNY